MTQHFMTDGRNTESVCGYDMVGRRNPAIDTDINQTNCVECIAVYKGQALYAVTATDEDGNEVQVRFLTPAEQLAYTEFCFDEGATQVTLQIISLEDIKNGN